MTTLDTPLTKVAVVGKTAAKQLERDFGMDTVGDLLYHFPRRYVERGEFTDIASLEVGTEVTVLAKVISCKPRPMKNRPEWIVNVAVGDGSGGVLALTFFAKDMHKAQWRARQLPAGRQGLFAGTVSTFKKKLQLTHPDYRMLDVDDEDEAAVEEFAGGLIPVYPA